MVEESLALRVPYATFLTTTWVLKKVLSSSVNDQIGGFGDTLLLHPASPYWYLYALFFIFLVTLTFTTVRMATVGLAIAVVAKVYFLMGGRNIYCINCPHKRDLVCAGNEYLCI